MVPGDEVDWDHSTGMITFQRPPQPSYSRPGGVLKHAILAQANPHSSPAPARTSATIALPSHSVRSDDERWTAQLHAPPLRRSSSQTPTVKRPKSAILAKRALRLQPASSVWLSKQSNCHNNLKCIIISSEASPQTDETCGNRGSDRRFMNELW